MCSSATLCLKCIDNPSNYTLQDGDCGCNLDFYLNTTTSPHSCNSCFYICDQCTGTGRDNCIGCKKGYVLTGTSCGCRVRTFL